MGIITLIVSACSNKKLENLGVLKKKANEYSIARNAPLVMPPDMYLSPPQEKEMQVRIKRKNINDSEVTLDDILLGKTPSTVKKNKRKIIVLVILKNMIFFSFLFANRGIEKSVSIDFVKQVERISKIRFI